MMNTALVARPAPRDRPAPGSEKHNGRAISSKHAAVITALLAVVGPSPGAIAQALSPSPVYEANTTVPAKNGATEAVHVSVQSWGISGPEHEIPLRGFYVAHLLSGQISATIDGQTTQHLPGDYWTVRAGAAMRVRVVGEVAVLETTVVSKR
jgi:quercetin dioxygenase-like cupin family protein